MPLQRRDKARGRISTRRPEARSDPGPRTPRRRARSRANRTRRRRSRPAGSARRSPRSPPTQRARPASRPAGPALSARAVTVAGSPRLSWSSQMPLNTQPHERLGIKARLDRRDHDAVGELRIERPVLRLQMKVQSALLAPALQFHHPIALPRRMTLGERQAAGLGKQFAKKHRLVDDLAAVALRKILEQRVADIGPGRVR